jgi:hypothetical protein
MDRWTERFTSDGEKAIAIHDGSDFPDACFEGEREYDVMNALADYEDLEEQGLLVRLPCKVGDIVYVDSTILPIEDMEYYEDTDNKIPLIFSSRVVSFRFAKRNWVKIAVKAKWLYEWIDDETGPESDYIEREKTFSIPLSMIGKNVFLTREEAEKKLEEMKKND